MNEGRATITYSELVDQAHLEVDPKNGTVA